jgi:hypothetical protein
MRKRARTGLSFLFLAKSASQDTTAIRMPGGRVISRVEIVVERYGPLVFVGGADVLVHQIIAGGDPERLRAIEQTLRSPQARILLPYKREDDAVGTHARARSAAIPMISLTFLITWGQSGAFGLQNN